MKPENRKTAYLSRSTEQAEEILRRGGLVAVPTETVYGLACDGWNADAVEKLYAVKGRPAGKPLSLLVSDRDAIPKLCADTPPGAMALAERFWPGPLTLVLRSRGREPETVRAGGDTIGLRCPDHPLTLELLGRLDFPLATPSANPSGAPPARSAQEVLAYFDGAIDGILDGSATERGDGGGPVSTVFDMSRTPYRVLRAGALEEQVLAGALRENLTLIGITGGSGCGKTTALRVLGELGALVLDADAVYHQLTVSSGDMRRELTGRYGPVYDGDRLDRKKLAGIVFADPAALADLNAITHKYVNQELQRRLTEHAMNGGTLAAVDAIALLDTSLAEQTLYNVAVTAPLEQRVARLTRRDGISREAALARIQAQQPEDYFCSHCDYTLRNESTPEAFAAQCKAFFTEVLQYESGKSGKAGETGESAASGGTVLQTQKRV